ncbi:MAG: LysM peptidoglycan-binding domain-containing protein, partial [Armatimonadetes bacterium]|nr:LysM peptidoglycan-binding domain-containing protein [Armatimonadota bacterium]NIM24335.1 LysM peptidoglycan-binding domain-containing protein [Armatimonadota bacterium]NIM68204.1 LysM peptidoglycan-binding domain-containing protein [Armatimonadota bacterium]NIM75105.1 LysM peptidoglycan-binding domain-containing protein [Armatimonadota bacterium]NIN06409.1 LysM peptidoglycan-binding domain-containing protein [Armatimonadota bacterium]
MRCLQRILVPLVFLGCLGLAHTYQALAEAQSAAVEEGQPISVNTFFPSAEPDTGAMIPGVYQLSVPPTAQNDEVASRQERTAPPAAGPRAKSSPKPEAKTQGTTVSYKVRQGDTLVGIARAHGVSASAIVKANNLSNPRLIGIGKTLQIPGACRIPKNTSTPKKVVVTKPKPVAPPAAPAKTPEAKLSAPAEADVLPATGSAKQSSDDL